MNKILLLVFFYLTQVGLAFSQTIKDRGLISLSVGSAFAVGKFSSKDLYDNSSGFAKIGQSVSFSYSRLLSKNWGISGDIHGQRNPLNTNAIESDFSHAKIYQEFSFGSDPNNPPPQTTYTIYPSWKFDRKTWLYGALLLGGNGQFALDRSNRVNLITKVMFGAVFAKSPELRGSSVTDTATAYILQSKSSAFGFIYSFGGGLNYYLNKAIFLSSALTYIGTTQITFKDVKASLTTTKGTIGSPGYSIVIATS